MLNPKQFFDYLKTNAHYPLRNYVKNPHHIIKTLYWRCTTSISRERHVFIVGAPRSGTTLLQSVIANHSDYCTWQGESNLFTWRNNFSKSTHLGLNGSFISEKYRRCSNIVDFFDTCALQFRSGKEGSRFVEKTPQHIFQLNFISKRFPESSIIHIYRDGRDCYCSAQSASIPRSESLHQFAHYWRSCIEARRRIARASNVIDVCYEELTSVPEKCLGQIMEELGSVVEPSQLAASHRKKDRRAVQKKFSRLGEKIDSSSQQRWKTEMSENQVSAFNNIAGKQLKYLGYK